MEVSLTTTEAHRQRGACLVVPVHEGRRLGESARRVDEAAGGLLARLARGSALRGRVGQVLMLHNVPGAASDQVLLVGVGRRGHLDAAGYRRSLRAAFDALEGAGLRNAGVHLAEVEVEGHELASRVTEIALAAHETVYRFESLKSKDRRADPVRLRKVTIGVEDRAAARACGPPLLRAEAIAAGLALARDLGNMPGNVCTPAHLADQARRLARAHESLSVSVRGEAEMKRMRMGALLAVAQGSHEPARLITLEYSGGPKGQKPVVLVGKGVTFDSGGISIKPSASMDEMKYDMCGAASVLGTIAAVAGMGLAQNVVGVIPATENLPGGSAVKPGDVVNSMSGRSIEILNTDAEGRLILCDALTFAERFDPDVVIDVATLTGACVVALGAPASGLFANDDALAEALLDAGETSGDRAWRMPLWKEYSEQLRSNFADLANIGGREAGAVTAACFLGEFTRDYRWAHLDIAGSAWRTGKAKGSTGRPVRLLCQYLVDLAGRRRRG